jgi:hypothetical protein
VLDEIVQVLVYILGLGADGADWVAVVAVVQEDVGVLLKAFKVFGAARAGAVVVYAATDSEILVFRTNDSAKGYGCDDCSWRVSKMV